MRLAVVMSVFVLGLALGSCKKDDMMAEFEAWGNAACGCKDEACAKKQGEEFDRLENKYEQQVESSKEAENKVEAIMEKANACLEKFDVHAG